MYIDQQQHEHQQHQQQHKLTSLSTPVKREKLVNRLCQNKKGKRRMLRQVKKYPKKKETSKVEERDMPQSNLMTTYLMIK
jgi:hypothetical protein